MKPITAASFRVLTNAQSYPDHSAQRASPNQETPCLDDPRGANEVTDCSPRIQNDYQDI